MPSLHSLADAFTSALCATTVRPSTTLAALATFVTGLAPETHGLTEPELGLGLVGRLAKLKPLPRTLARAGIPSRIVASELPGMQRKAVRALTAVAGVAAFTNSGRRGPQVAHAALRHAERDEPGVIFVYLNDCDRAGHAHGWMSPQYLDAAVELDAAVGLLSPLTMDSLVVVLADHGGGGVTPTNHGEPHPTNDRIPLVLAGPRVKRRRQLTQPVSILDVPPTLCHWLGVPVPDWYEGRVLSEGFVESSAVAEIPV